jgi:hypothetical protein
MASSLESPVFGRLERRNDGWIGHIELFGHEDRVQIHVEAHFDKIDAAVALELLHQAEAMCRLIQPETEDELRRIAAAQFLKDSYQQCSGSPKFDEFEHLIDAMKLAFIEFGDECCLFVWVVPPDGTQITIQTNSQLQVTSQD